MSDAAVPTRPWPLRWLREAAGLDQALDATRWLFLRALGLVYFAAYVSLAGQLPSFHASGGLISTAARLERIQEMQLEGLFWQKPSLFWLNAGDPFIYTLGWGGVLLSLLLIANLGTRWVLPALWVIYLSFINVGEPFFPFQWDQLLLEAGFLAIFVALPRRASLILVWLLRWLAFRVMFMNGLVKIIGVDPTYLDGTTSPWRDGSALKYHYETQPLPTAAAWFFHQAPLWFHQFCTYFTIVVEIVAPFLFFLGRWPRLVAVVLLGSIHGMILITGSHAFYNWLSLVLFIPLLDDGFLRRVLPGRWMEAIASGWSPWRLWRSAPKPEDRPAPSRMLYWLASVGWGVFAVVFVVLSLAASASWVFRQADDLSPGLRDWMNASVRLTQPWHITSGYGAFSHMTRTRPEIIFLGSNDGRDWQEYGFCYKPGRLDRAPNLAAPHHPRLDWQLWFTALGQPSPWMVGVVHGLLTDKPAILRMVCENPFADKPPRYIRVAVYHYNFTNWEEAAEGAWWKRRFKGYASPVFTLTPDGKLTTAP